MCLTEFLSLSGSQISHCSGRKFDVAPFREQHRCPMVGQALRCLQIGDQGRKFRFHTGRVRSLRQEKRHGPLPHIPYIGTYMHGVRLQKAVVD